MKFFRRVHSFWASRQPNVVIDDASYVIAHNTYRSYERHIALLRRTVGVPVVNGPYLRRRQQ